MASIIDGIMGSPERLRRWGAAAGLVGIGLFVAGTYSAGVPPKPDAAAGTVVAHLVDHRTAILAGVAMVSVAIPLLLCFFAALWSVIREAEGPTSPFATAMLVLWVFALGVLVAGRLPLDAVAWRGAGQFDPHTVRLAFDINSLALWALTAPAAALAVLAPSIVIWRTGCLPRWTAWLGVLKALASVPEVIGVFSLTGLNAAGYAGGVGAVTLVAWVTGAAIALLMQLHPGAE